MDKIIAQSQGDPDLGTPAQDVTCVFTGSNFILKAKKVSGFPNYDDSKFGPPSEIENIHDEKYANDLISQMHDISQYVSPEKFKSYEELQKRLFDKIKKTGNRSAADELSGAINSGNDFDAQLNAYESAAVKAGQETGMGQVYTDDELEKLLSGQ